VARWSEGARPARRAFVFSGAGPPGGPRPPARPAVEVPWSHPGDPAGEDGAGCPRHRGEARSRRRGRGPGAACRSRSTRVRHLERSVRGGEPGGRAGSKNRGHRPKPTHGEQSRRHLIVSWSRLHPHPGIPQAALLYLSGTCFSIGDVVSEVDFRQFARDVLAAPGLAQYPNCVNNVVPPSRGKRS